MELPRPMPRHQSVVTANCSSVVEAVFVRGWWRRSALSNGDGEINGVGEPAAAFSALYKPGELLASGANLTLGARA